MSSGGPEEGIVNEKSDPLNSSHNDANTNPKAMPPAGRSTFRSICIVMTCTFAMVVNSSNNTSVSIGLPTIGKALNIEEARLQWLVSAYSLSSGCLLLFFGRLADLYGRKKTFIIGSLSLTAFTLGCGFAQDEITLDVLRGFQGIGAAATIPASLGILAHAFPPSRARSIAFATFAAGAPIGAVFGMVLGGVLIELTKPTWRSTFYLTAALTALCLIGGLFSIDPDTPSTETDKRVDWIGAVLVTFGLVLIVFVLNEGELAPQKWRTPYIIALLIIGVLFVLLFLAWQYWLERVGDGPKGNYFKMAPPPLMKLSLWGRARGRFAVMQWIAFLNWSCFLSFNFWVQLYYQNYLQLSPLLTVARLLPMFITGVACNAIIAMLVGRVPVVYLIGSGTILTGTASLLFAVINTSSPYWAFGFPAAILSVFGTDFVFASGTIFVAKVALPHEQSMAGGLFQTMTQLGTALGLTITTIVFNRVVDRDLTKMGLPSEASGLDGPSGPQLEGYRAAQWTAFGFGILASVLAFLFLGGAGIVGHQQGDKQESDGEVTVTDEPEKQRTSAQHERYTQP